MTFWPKPEIQLYWDCNLFKTVLFVIYTTDFYWQKIDTFYSIQKKEFWYNKRELLCMRRRQDDVSEFEYFMWTSTWSWPPPPSTCVQSSTWAWPTFSMMILHPETCDWKFIYAKMSDVVMILIACPLTWLCVQPQPSKYKLAVANCATLVFRRSWCFW